MRLALAASILAGLTAAIPSPALADTPAQLAERASVSDACASQPDGYGPVPRPNTVTRFLQFGTLSTYSTIATAPTGYQRTFHVQMGATTGAGYIGLYTLNAYDAMTCTNICDSSPGCVGVNLYYERDPALNPAPACTNPTAINNIKCTLWSKPPTYQNATNLGQIRQSFQVAIAGSNGYAKVGSLPANTADYAVNPYI